MKIVILAVFFSFVAGCGSDLCEGYCDTFCDALAQCGVVVRDCLGECSSAIAESTDRVCEEGRRATDKASCVEIREVARAIGWL